MCLFVVRSSIAFGAETFRAGHTRRTGYHLFTEFVSKNWFEAARFDLKKFTHIDCNLEKLGERMPAMRKLPQHLSVYRDAYSNVPPDHRASWTAESKWSNKWTLLDDFERSANVEIAMCEMFHCILGTLFFCHALLHNVDINRLHRNALSNILELCSDLVVVFNSRITNTEHDKNVNASRRGVLL